MTHPLSKHWKQPNPENFHFDELNEYVLMTSGQLNQLREYSKSTPSAVYPGKMWRGTDDGETWFLHWWDHHPTNPEKCVHRMIEIILTD